MKNKILISLFTLVSMSFISANCTEGFQYIVIDEIISISGCRFREYADTPEHVKLCIQDAKNDAERKIEELACQCGYYCS